MPTNIEVNMNYDIFITVNLTAIWLFMWWTAAETYKDMEWWCEIGYAVVPTYRERLDGIDSNPMVPQPWQYPRIQERLHRFMGYPHEPPRLINADYSSNCIKLEQLGDKESIKSSSTSAKRASRESNASLLH